MKLNLKIFHRLRLHLFIVPKSLAPLGLMTILGLGGVNWLVISYLTPQVAQAHTAQTEVTLSVQPEESFQTLVQRAEAVARAATQRLFDRDILITDVEVTVLGQNDGQIVPLLKVEVSRQAWRTQPEASHWATYFTNASNLLQFGQTTAVDAQPPAPSPAQTQTQSQFETEDDTEELPTPPNTELLEPGVGVTENDTETPEDELETESLDEEAEDELETETLREEIE